MGLPFAFAVKDSITGKRGGFVEILFLFSTFQYSHVYRYSRISIGIIEDIYIEIELCHPHISNRQYQRTIFHLEKLKSGIFDKIMDRIVSKKNVTTQRSNKENVKIKNWWIKGEGKILTRIFASSLRAMRTTQIPILPICARKIP